VLRGLRIALGVVYMTGSSVPPHSIGYSFGERLAGWNSPADEAYDLTLADDVSDLLGHPVLAIPDPPRRVTSCGVVYDGGSA
jgi:hypothetical protein